MNPPTTRTAYRALLRELPRRNKTRLLAVPPTPLHQRLREIFRTPTSTSNPTPATESAKGERGERWEIERQARIEEANQLATYARAQRTYATLLERYNPGIFEVDQQERVRRTARRVGMEMPVDAGDRNGSGSGNGDKDGK